ncbi:MAG: alpha/beta hydrolase [Planctomycetes bacterium]|nr:alpha/beta hydrolase [Planctomycetota bacterium]
MIAALFVWFVLPQGPSDFDPLDRPVPATAPSAAIELRDGEGAVARLVPYDPPLEFAHGGAVLVLPGGGYGHLARHEGEDYARWLNALGFHAYVLEYRLGNAGHPHPAPVRDAAMALAWIRADERFPIDPERVGVIGSSAGGHLAATIAAFDPASAEFEGLPHAHARPDFAVLCYPVISMRDPLGHAGSRRNLLGASPGPELVTRLSIETQVDAKFPPCFVWHGADDAVVPARNAYALADALAQNGVAHELHVYERAAHGIGLGLRDPVGHSTRELHDWAQACAEWLVARFGSPREAGAKPVKRTARLLPPHSTNRGLVEIAVRVPATTKRC